MTAEVAIMNKSAVAIAADSAVTVTGAHGEKIYNSVNKVFTLSKIHPVGLMIYGSAEFIGVPWETIIKIYRRKLSKKAFDRLEMYGEDFISFLANNAVFSPEMQDRNLRAKFEAYFHYLRETINSKVEEFVQQSQKQRVSQGGIKKIIRETVDGELIKWQQAEYVEGFSQIDCDAIMKVYKEVVLQFQKQILPEKLMSKSVTKNLEKICSFLFCKKIFPSDVSGIVITGFGEQDVFPALCQYQFETIINGKVKGIRQECNSLSESDSGATVYAFAQREMVVTFMTGVHPLYDSAVNRCFKSMLSEYMKLILNETQKSQSEQSMQHLTTQLEKISANTLDKFIQFMQQFQRNSLSGPVLSAIEALPKDELAKLAESLVNLTVLRRKISMDSETVGGAIDVAVISKGDGFIWIKRKHYFPPELNHHFFKNYFFESAGESS